MRLKLAMALLLGTLLIVASPAGANRTDSGYSPRMAMPMPMPIPGGVDWLWDSTFCFNPAATSCSSTPLGPLGTDLFVEITPNSFSLPLNVTLDLSPSFNPNMNMPPDSPFGQIVCSGSIILGGPSSPIPGPCTSSSTNGTPPPGCALPNPAPGTDITITLPSSCLQAGEVFYFDLADTNNISVTAGSSTVPEPSSLVLLGAALIPVAFLARRRQEA